MEITNVTSRTESKMQTCFSEASSEAGGVASASAGFGLADPFVVAPPKEA